MYKVVIDTNLLINGSADDYNYGSRIIDLVLEGKLAAYANPPTLRENRLLAGLKVQDLRYLKKLRAFFYKVRRIDSTGFHFSGSQDPEDNKIVDSALAARADFLITSDRHLLCLQEVQGTAVVTPETFWSKYEESTGISWKQWLTQFIKSQ